MSLAHDRYTIPHHTPAGVTYAGVGLNTFLRGYALATHGPHSCVRVHTVPLKGNSRHTHIHTSASQAYQTHIHKGTDTRIGGTNPFLGSLKTDLSVTRD